jgi:hypothetical protein
MKLYRSPIWLLLLLILAACGSNAEEGVIVTFLVAGQEEYRIQLTDPDDIETARKLLAGEEAPKIPNGLTIHYDPGVNEGYSWYFDPKVFEFADFTTEVCDGLPSDVERGILTYDYYCPWAAEVIAIDG